MKFIVKNKKVPSVKKIAKPKKPETFDGSQFDVPHNAHLKFMGGHMLSDVEVETIFLGAGWSGSPQSDYITQINSFFTFILQSSFMDDLREYSIIQKHINNGTLGSTNTFLNLANVSTISDLAIQNILQNLIDSEMVPAPNQNKLYFIYIDNGTQVFQDGQWSCIDFCGYHFTFNNIYYAVIPYPSCGGCLGGLSVIDSLTATSSHELAEAITDADPNNPAWYDDNNGEIGDICAWNFKTVGGYNIQLEWSNKRNNCI